jgi:hypothetical protein
MLRWSRQLDFYVEADSGGYWLLDMPLGMTAEVDAQVNDRIVACGFRTGFANLYLVRLEQGIRMAEGRC